MHIYIRRHTERAALSRFKDSKGKRQKEGKRKINCEKELRRKDEYAISEQ
jgi:hypothetical protein